MRRATTVLALGALALLTVPAPASAAPKVPLGAAPPLHGLPLCGTTVSVVQVTARAKVGDKGRVTGAATFRITDERTGRSVVVNASGPGSQTESLTAAGILTITISATGPSLFFPLDADEAADFAAAGLPDLLLTRGPVTLVVTLDVSQATATTPPRFISTVVDVPRRVVDGCTLLT